MRIKIIPGKGIQIGKKEILLDSLIYDNLKDFTTYEHYENSYYLFDGAILVTVTETGVIHEIELRVNKEDNILVLYEDFDIFFKEKEEVLAFFETMNGQPYQFTDYTYSFENLRVKLSFGMSEEELAEVIRESKNDGVYEMMKEDIEKDAYRTKHVECFLLYSAS